MDPYIPAEYVPQCRVEGTAPALVIDGLVVVVRPENGRLVLHVDTEGAGPLWGNSDHVPVYLYLNSAEEAVSC